MGQEQNFLRAKDGWPGVASAERGLLAASVIQAYEGHEETRFNTKRDDSRVNRLTYQKCDP